MFIYCIKRKKKGSYIVVRVYLWGLGRKYDYICMSIFERIDMILLFRLFLGNRNCRGEGEKRSVEDFKNYLFYIFLYCEFFIINIYYYFKL